MSRIIGNLDLSFSFASTKLFDQNLSALRTECRCSAKRLNQTDNGLNLISESK